MAKYEVIVGNVGTVYSGDDKDEAERIYGIYEKASMFGAGRAGNEHVALMRDDEILVEFEQ